MAPTKHEYDRQKIEKSRREFEKWPTDRLRAHLAQAESVLYRHARLAIKQILAEREGSDGTSGGGAA